MSAAAKERLDLLIAKARVDLYKPIQIAEVLRAARLKQAKIDFANLESYRNPSIAWRNAVTKRLLNKHSTSSARYQHDVWNDNAMPAAILKELDKANQESAGVVERYIYAKFAERQNLVSKLLTTIQAATPTDFQLSELLSYFESEKTVRRSVDKVYEIVTHALFETVVRALKATVTVAVPAESRDLLNEFQDLASVLLGLSGGVLEKTVDAHIYRVGVTNAADRGLDMWANFGPAVQVKHLSLSEELASEIVDQVESDHIVIVCRSVDAVAIRAITKQISWGRRIRGIVTEKHLGEWYEKCLRGKYGPDLGPELLRNLELDFQEEFPQTKEIAGFMTERGYDKLSKLGIWTTDADKAIKSHRR